MRNKLSKKEMQDQLTQCVMAIFKLEEEVSEANKRLDELEEKHEELVLVVDKK